MTETDADNAILWMVGATCVLSQNREAVALAAITECGYSLQPGECASDVLHRLDAMSDHELRALLVRNGKLPA